MLKHYYGQSYTNTNQELTFESAAVFTFSHAELILFYSSGSGEILLDMKVQKVHWGTGYFINGVCVLVFVAISIIIQVKNKVDTCWRVEFLLLTSVHVFCQKRSTARSSTLVLVWLSSKMKAVCVNVHFLLVFKDKLNSRRYRFFGQVLKTLQSTRLPLCLTKLTLEPNHQLYQPPTSPQ